MAIPPDQLALPVEWVSRDHIRKILNEERYWEKVQSGELISEVRKDLHPSSPPQGEPICTRSQYVIYRTAAGEYVAGVHQYLRPDGTIGGSKRPDPNRLVVNGRILAYSPRKSPI